MDTMMYGAFPELQAVPEQNELTALPGSEAAKDYFRLIRRALPLAKQCLAERDVVPNRNPEMEIYEGAVMDNMIGRLLYSISALEMKFAFKEDGDVANRLRVDLTESGFPAYMDVDGLVVDLMHRDATLKDMPSTTDELKKLCVDCLFKERRKSQKLFEALAQRTYVEMLDRDKLFLTYTPGELISWKTKEKGVRAYIFSWGTYDLRRSCPYIHLMFFTQDASEIPFEDKGNNLPDFLKVMKDEGQHVPESLEVLAKGIDQRLDPIHPKIIKRVRIGPLFAPQLIKQRPQEKLTEVEQTLQGLFERTGTDEFVLRFTEEIIFSKGQVTERRFLLMGVEREVFYIPPPINGSMTDAYHARSSDVYSHILMPHRLFQVMQSEEKERVPNFARMIKFTYDNKEKVHEIS